MKTIFHSDYWVEIPAGEYSFGLSREQRQKIADRLLEQVGYSQLAPAEQALMDNALLKIRKQVEKITEFYREFLKNGFAPRELVSTGLSDDEFALITRQPIKPLFNLEMTLSNVPFPIAVSVKTFYMARFPLTEYQERQLLGGVTASELPGALDEPDGPGEIARIQNFSVCEALGCRVPSRIEWEKAARGADGRLYPWGNEWDPAAGYFYSGQPLPQTNDGYRVAEFPRGVSPYGIWGMAGGIPEAVQDRQNKRDIEAYFYTSKGCHSRESSEETAWFDHIVVLPGKGDWVSLRPVLDKWPQQQWTGFRQEENRA